MGTGRFRFLDNLDNEIKGFNRNRDFKRIDISPAIYDRFDLEDCFNQLEEIEMRSRDGKFSNLSDEKSLKKQLRNVKSSLVIDGLSKGFQKSSKKIDQNLKKG